MKNSRCEIVHTQSFVETPNFLTAFQTGEKENSGLIAAGLGLIGIKKREKKENQTEIY